MNQVIFMGRLTDDPKLNYSQSKEPMAISKISIAVARSYKKENEVNTDFFSCTAFGSTAEFISKYFSKGDMILIVGEMRNNNYTDKNGEKRYSQEVLINKVEFCGANNKKDNPSDESVDDENLPY